MKASLAVAFAVGTSLITAAQAQEPVLPNIVTAPGIADTATSDTAEFRAEALQSDAASIAASRLALQRSRDPDIRDYAERVLVTRKATSAALLPPEANLDTNGSPLSSTTTRPANGTSGGVRVALGSAGRARVDQLKSARNADSFDRNFVAQQVRSDARTLALYTSYARSGDSEQGRQFANEALPYIAAQLDRANGLQTRFGI